MDTASTLVATGFVAPSTITRATNKPAQVNSTYAAAGSILRLLISPHTNTVSMKLITFLGTNKYVPTTYQWMQWTAKTRLFPLALQQWLKPSETFVFLTQAAAEHENWSELNAATSPTPVPIDDGADTAGLWRIFDSVVQQVQPDDELVIDITHGFRSLPMLGLLVAAYLKTAKNVTIKHLLYGAYEARDVERDVTPVFELTSFLSLFDWMIAADHFVRTGYGNPLTDLLAESDGVVGELSQSILSLSEGLQLLRPNSVADSAATLGVNVQRAKSDVARSVPPLATILDGIAREYGQFSHKEGGLREKLYSQLCMVEWYYQRGQFVHALSLAREWLPTLLCVHFNADVMDKREREDMELLLAGGKLKDPKTGDTRKESPRLNEWNSVPANSKLRQLWGGTLNLANLRNDVLHAGFRKNAKEPVEIKFAVAAIVTELRSIWMEYDASLPGRSGEVPTVDFP